MFYGDPTRPELLRAAGAEQARVLVVALEDMAASLIVVDMAQRLFPHLTIAARARNRRHAHLLMDRGVRIIVRETFHSSLRLTEMVLAATGLDSDAAARTVETFRAHDERALIAQHAVHHDEQKLIQSAREAAQELQSLFEADKGGGLTTGQGQNGSRIIPLVGTQHAFTGLTLPAGEGAFLACSFWLADVYVLLGRGNDARQLFERLISLANDVGLLSEEYDATQQRLVGNFPQAFSHIALVNTAHNLTLMGKPCEQRSENIRLGDCQP